jgi:hypothetical protein
MDEEGRSIRQTGDGGFIVGASTASFGAGQGDLWMLKLDAGARTEWQKTYGGAGDEGRIRSSEQTPDGGYIVAVGETTSFGGGLQDAWLLKLDARGGVQWQKTFGGRDYDEAEVLRQTSDGGFIVVGNTESFGAGGDDFWIMKLRADGSFDAACPVLGDTNATPEDTKVESRASAVIARDVAVVPRDTVAVVRDTASPARFVCPGEICYGGADDDADGDVDCEDADCAGQNACLPDLVSEPKGSFFAGPVSWNGGTEVAATLRVKNQSASGAAGFSVATFLSDDANPDPGDKLVAVHEVDGLAAGDTIVINIRISRPESMRDNYLMSWIDSTDAATPGGRGNVEESDERNNGAAARIQPGVP